VIIVHASSANTTSATLETYRRVTGGWSRQFAAMSARIGKDGFSDHHVEGVPSTPIGMFGFGSTMYGVNANPGVGYAYHRLVTNDWWNENPDSSAYNTFEHSSSNPGGGSEELWKQTVAYQYFAFIKYNVPAVAGRGSGIFLHETHTSSTSGCVSLPKADLIKVLTWLNPSDNPRIVLSPDADLGHY
jgi:L,D-peptidoglycan transpeptidase YkuD (ErfK/YbiS/YcfS/YnhG family)